MSFRLPTTEEKADYVLNQFNRIAKRYDLANDTISLGMHRLWKEKAIIALDVKPGGKYLDVCCGTGDLTLRIAKKIFKTRTSGIVPTLVKSTQDSATNSPSSNDIISDYLSSNGTVVGLDFSPNMLEIAKVRFDKEKSHLLYPEFMPSVSFVEGDAQSLPFSDNYFDGAIISFGLRNLTDLDKGLSEMVRVVKSGGNIVNLDLGRPTNVFFTPIYYFYFRHIVPIIGQLLQKDVKAYTYLPRSLDTYPAPVGISKLFQEAGLRNVQYLPLAMESVALHIGAKP